MADHEDNEGIGSNDAPKPKKRGRPLKELNYDYIKGMRQIQCTEREIATAIGMSYIGLQDRKKRDEQLRVALDEGEVEGKISLRRRMWDKANKGNGNVAMLIWLSKNWLGMSDKMQTTTDTQKTGVLVVPSEQTVEQWAETQKRKEVEYNETEVQNL